MTRKLFDERLFSIINPDSSIEVGAKLYWYEANTTVLAVTYTTPAGMVANSNPVLANADGRFPSMWLEPGDYKYVLTAADGSPADPEVTQDDYTVEAAPPEIDPALYDFLAGDVPLPIANGGTNATAAGDAAVELEVLALSGGELTGQLTQDNAGAYLYNADTGMSQGAVFLIEDGDPDPAGYNQPGMWLLKYTP